MLIYYILSFLFNIHLTFCYDYLNNDETIRRLRPIYRHEKKNPRRNMDSRSRNEYRELELGYNEPVAQFDVASFIQNSDNRIESLRDRNFAQRDNRRYSKEYTDYDSLINVEDSITNNNHRDSWKDYLDMAETSAANMKSSLKPLVKGTYGKDFDYNSINVNDLTKYKRKDSNKVNHFQENTYHNSFFEDSAIHHPQKKGVLKNFKFPFFFRNKTTAMVSPKKDKKRKTSKSFKASKSKHSLDVDPEDSVAENLYGVDPKYMYNKKKRSYIDSLCPACKKKYMEKLNPVPKTRHVTDKIVHNSRQFYQNLFTGKRINGKKNVGVSTDYVEQVRYRRQKFSDKERQLKELEEVTKKIEGEVITNAANRNSDTDLHMLL